MKLPTGLIGATFALGLCVMAGAAPAQDMTPPTPTRASQAGQMEDASMAHRMEHGNNGSMHTMPATVTSADAATGQVEVMAGSMALKLHFPPSSMASLKAGDKITLHLGYSMP